jgi:hypothetical protein
MRNGISMNIDMPIEHGDEMLIGSTSYIATQQPNGEFNLQAIPNMPNNNVNPAFQRRQEEQRQRDRQRAADAQRERVTRSRSPITYQIGPDTFTALPNGDRDFEAELRAQLPATPSESYIAAADADYERRMAQRERTTSIIDQMRPLQDSYMQDWVTRSGVIFYDSGNRQGAPRYAAGVDAIDNGIAGSMSDVHVYDRNTGFTIRDLDDMAARIRERVRPEGYENQEQALNRYGQQLTPEDQQRLGYVAPAEGSRSGSNVVEYGRTRRTNLRDAFLTPPAEMDRLLAYTFGDRPSAASVLSMMTEPTLTGDAAFTWGRKEPAGKFVPDPAIEQARLAKEQAEADEWLKNSPWG